LIADVRVTQNAASASVHSRTKRRAIAKRSAGTKATRCHGCVSATAPNETSRKIATGATIVKVSALKVRFSAISLWMGWMGRSSSGEKNPSRTRQSKKKKCQVNVSWLTIIRTVKYAAKAPAVKPPTAPPWLAATVVQTTR
jgi:hypothetical protein